MHAYTIYKFCQFTIVVWAVLVSDLIFLISHHINMEENSNRRHFEYKMEVEANNPALTRVSNVRSRHWCKHLLNDPRVPSTEDLTG